jgi:NADPH-dependent 2,4-dienoyl-CoA reductase/sulfur reductase-like enzyme
VELADGASLHADAIVVATGLAARTLPGQPAGVHTLRTLDDALTLRAALERAGSLLVVGGGFIGAEVASSARTLGLAVTVLEALPVPSARALGEELGALTGRLMTEAGVDLRTDVRIKGFVAQQRRRRERQRRGRRSGSGASDKPRERQAARADGGGGAGARATAAASSAWRWWTGRGDGGRRGGRDRRRAAARVDGRRAGSGRRTRRAA